MEKAIAQQRLLSQRIEGEKWKRPEEVVRWMGALQAQDYLQSLWAIGLRTQAATVVDIEQAITDRKLLRTWPMRGTLHFVPAEDAQWMLKLSEERMIASDKRRQAQLELDYATLERAGRLFSSALQGGQRLTRPEMMKLLENAGISTSGQRGYHILWYSSQIGLICLGPLEKKQQTFVLLDEWVPSPRRLAREDALTELTRRYMTSHGPATLRDFAHWAGLTLTEARAGLEGAKAELHAEKIDGQEYWMAESSASQAASHSPGVHLLPGFDEYLLGYKDRSAVLAVEHVLKIVPGKNGVFLPIVVVEGQVVGTWRRTVGKRTLAVQLNPFARLGDAEKAATEVAKIYQTFLGLPATALSITTQYQE